MKIDEWTIISIFTGDDVAADTRLLFDLLVAIFLCSLYEVVQHEREMSIENHVYTGYC